MRICFVCQEDIVRPQGGTGTYVRNMSIALAQHGHDVHVISRRRQDSAEQLVDGVKVHRVPAPGPPVLYSPLFFRASHRRFIELQDGAPFDLVHGNLPLMSSFGMRGGGLPPVVETLHCTVAKELANISSQSSGNLNFNEVLSRLLRVVWLRREAYLLGRARHVISVSQGLRREIVAQYPPTTCSPGKISVISNGVDCSRFAPRAPSAAHRSATRRALGISPDQPVILYLGRLMERKRVADLVQTLPLVLNEVPRVQLLVVGKHNSCGERVEALADQLGVREHLLMIDHVPYAQVPEYFAAADVYCLPSSYEGFPFTVLEAMASGTPVVASDIAGIDEQVQDGETGLLQPVGDIAALSKNICRLLKDRELAVRLAANARRMVAEEYDWNVIGARTEELFLSLVQERARPNRVGACDQAAKPAKARARLGGEL